MAPFAAGERPQLVFVRTARAITYMVDGRQYVLMAAGTTLTAFVLAEF